MELHPDRNYGNVEDATTLFAEVQSAYEVLSDPQERAWYNSHRDAFLGGDSTTETTDYSYDTRMTTAADILKLFSKFSPRMDFTDSPDGFYGGLREIFSRLALEEKMACRWETVEYTQYPPFGGRDDSFMDVVRPFYAWWGSFSTKKSFAWKDAYRYSDAPDRRVRRLMEKENKRLREESIREFNEAVRSLVAFVKKRDPRYQSNAQNEAQRQETIRQSAAAQAARSRAANQSKLRDHVIQDWARSEGYDEAQSDMSEPEAEIFECVACHKTFKSQNQFEAHERSKKHVKAVKQLRWEMRVQNEQLGLEEHHNYDDQAQEYQSTHEDIDHLQSVGQETTMPHCAEGVSTDVEGVQESHQQRSERERHGTEPFSRVTTTSPSLRETVSGSDQDADYTSREIVEDRLSSLSLAASPDAPNAIDSLPGQISTPRQKEPKESEIKKLGKAKQKRARKALRPRSDMRDM